MAHGMSQRGPVTAVGRRNWELIVSLAPAGRGDGRARTALADALAALVAEVTPSHREVLAATYHRQGALGRFHTWALPPVVTGGRSNCERWAAMAFLDCVDRVVDTFAVGYSDAERLQWRAAAQAYTGGAERRPVVDEAEAPAGPAQRGDDQSPFGPVDLS